jgi:2-polyprenyl-3-methyl-5-hydroxy-6-metoxy-1,4-benzoquinol methylase
LLLKNRFLRYNDFIESAELSVLKDVFDKYYIDKWRGTPHSWGAKYPDKIITHWSREWEYPWAIMSGNIKEGENVLDCGCGGSPFLPFIVEEFKCNGYGIDLGFGDRIKDYNVVINSSEPLANLRHFFVDPSEVVNGNITIKKQNMTDIKYQDNFFDKVFCISVIEHMEENDAINGICEMVRVLKPGGKLLMTIDHTSYKNHVKAWCEGQFREIIALSGLELDGGSDFSLPDDSEVHGYYHVVGFVLYKG